MAIDQNGQGTKLYRCHHRGQRCPRLRRTNVGRLPARVEDLVAQRRKLVRLYYADKIGAGVFITEGRLRV